MVLGYPSPRPPGIYRFRATAGWFRAKGTLSAGTVEGLNNKAKLATRKPYGFRTFKAAEIALYHTLGRLPEPECTHRFWRGGFFSATSCSPGQRAAARASCRGAVSLCGAAGCLMALGPTRVVATRAVAV